MTDFHYYTIKDASSFEIEPIKKSRFIAHLLPFNESDKLSAHLLSLKQEYPHANHHCWAYHILTNNQIRFNDDGEPAGSAGKPILNHLQGNKLVNALMIVTRIFGGTKLGVGGLVRAYGQAASAIIANSELIPMIPSKSLSFVYHYETTSLVEQALYSLKLTPLSSSFGNTIKLEFKIPIAEYEYIVQRLLEITQNKIVISSEPL